MAMVTRGGGGGDSANSIQTKHIPCIIVVLLVRAGRRVCRSLLVRQNLGTAFAAVQRSFGQLPSLRHVLDYAARAGTPAAARRHI